jgi:hypothetical protein
VENLRDPDIHRRFADHLFEETGFDVRGEVIDPFYVADINGASTVELVDNQLRITIWRPGERETVVVKD